MYDKCPACNHPERVPYHGVQGAYRCVRCGAVYGSIPYGVSKFIVRSAWYEAGTPPVLERYYDFTDPNTGERRHGWFDEASRTITQVG